MRLETKEDVLIWEALLKKTRGFFDQRGLHEVSTPHLVAQGAFESAIDTLKVTNLGKELHTSPEIEMKHLIAKTGLSMYQICKCFRDDPATGIHWKEFTMLEFYRMGVSYRQIIDDMKAYLDHVSGRTLTYAEMTTYEAIRKYADVDLTDKTLVTKLCENENFSDAFFRLMVEKVEPALDPKAPVIITDYPLAVSPLSKRKESTDLAERFEIYWHGMELCNGCTELEGPEELKQRYDQEKAIRTQVGKPVHTFPETLYQAMKNMPPCAGVAVGLERIYLCLQK